MKTRKLYVRLVLLQLFSVITLTAPLALVLIANRERYFIETGATVKLCAGGMIALGVLLLSVAGKLHLPRRVTLTFVVVLMSWLLEAVLEDLFILSSMVLIGVVADALIFEPLCRRTKAEIEREKNAAVTAGVTAEAVKSVLQSFGRV